MKRTREKTTILLILVVLFVTISPDGHSQNITRKNLKFSNFGPGIQLSKDERIGAIYKYSDQIFGVSYNFSKKNKQVYHLYKYENNNWTPFLPELNLDKLSEPSVIFFNDTLFAAYIDDDYHQPAIRKYSNGKWLYRGSISSYDVEDSTGGGPRSFSRTSLSTNGKELYLMVGAGMNPYCFKMIQDEWIRLGDIISDDPRAGNGLYILPNSLWFTTKDYNEILSDGINWTHLGTHINPNGFEDIYNCPDLVTYDGKDYYLISLLRKRQESGLSIYALSTFRLEKGIWQLTGSSEIDLRNASYFTLFENDNRAFYAYYELSFTPEPKIVEINLRPGADFKRDENPNSESKNVNVQSDEALKIIRDINQNLCAYELKSNVRKFFYDPEKRQLSWNVNDNAYKCDIGMVKISKTKTGSSSDWNLNFISNIEFPCITDMGNKGQQVGLLREFNIIINKEVIADKLVEEFSKLQNLKLN